jgi:hypothetical protein
MKTKLAAVAVAGWMVSAAAPAALLVPAGLAPGEPYQLAFVTSLGTGATSGDIGFYNAFVQAAADAAGIGATEAVTWSAIASTATVDANTNAVVSAKVFNMNSELVATGFADFWDGSHTTGVGIDYNENGVGTNFNVWTGTLANGTGGGLNALGNPVAIWGESTLSSGSWVNRGAQNTTVVYRLYGLSEPLTAPIPEPHTWMMLLAGLALVGMTAGRRLRGGLNEPHATAPYRLAMHRR